MQTTKTVSKIMTYPYSPRQSNSSQKDDTQKESQKDDYGHFYI